jgi:hypothetical protein
MARTPVLPDATPVGALSAHLRRSRPPAVGPTHAFKIGLLDGREGQESGRRRYEQEAPGPVTPRILEKPVNANVSAAG